MRQIHIDVEESEWDLLVTRTMLWPEDKRNQAGICRYAIAELLHDMTEYPEDPVAPPMELGTKHIQVRTDDAEEAALWATVAARYTSYTAMLRVALAQLSESMA